MLRFYKVFKNRHVVLPVIHVESQDQALRNTARAKDNGCDGVFLINHGMDSYELLKIQAECRKIWPEYFIGVNCLELGTSIFNHVDLSTVSGVWTDNAGINETTGMVGGTA